MGAAVAGRGIVRHLHDPGGYRLRATGSCRSRDRASAAGMTAVLPDRAHLERLFEGAPRFLDRVEAAAPFADDDALFASARTMSHAMPEAEQIELIDAHPRLGAPPGTVSALSYVEQGYDRRPPAEQAQVDVAAELERLNAAYEDRFGFRYCVFVAGRPRVALLPDMAAALDPATDRTAELHRALDAVVDIAIDRHAKLRQEVAT